MRAALSPIAQTAVAAGAAWWLARHLLPEPRPVFAPLAAIVALGATRGERGRRALQVSLGVSIGVGAAELIVRLLGAGTLQLALVTGLALVVAVFLFEATTFVVQAGVSAALVVATSRAVATDRFLEALVGAAVALLMSQVLFPVDAVAKVRAAVSAALPKLADGLDEAAAELDTGESPKARAASDALRRANTRVGDVERALAAARESARLSRRRRADRDELERFEGIEDDLGATVSAADALARAVARLRGGPGEAPTELSAALRGLGDLARDLAGDLDREGHELLDRARTVTAHAAAAARHDPRPTAATASTLARSVAQGLLNVGGVEPEPAADALEEAAAAGREERDPAD